MPRSAEQQTRALKRANEVRAYRACVRQDIGNGVTPVEEALVTDWLQRVRVLEVVSWLPWSTGRTNPDRPANRALKRAASLLHAVGIPDHLKLRDLSADERARLAKAYNARRNGK